MSEKSTKGVPDLMVDPAAVTEGREEMSVAEQE